jgi:hypothetical protein
MNTSSLLHIPLLASSFVKSNKVGITWDLALISVILHDLWSFWEMGYLHNGANTYATVVSSVSSINGLNEVKEEEEISRYQSYGSVISIVYTVV